MHIGMSVLYGTLMLQINEALWYPHWLPMVYKKYAHDSNFGVFYQMNLSTSFGVTSVVNHRIAPMPEKSPRQIWLNTLHEPTKNS